MGLLQCVTACGPLPPEVPVQDIKLAAPLDSPTAQISGMAWCQGRLLLLPQYPGFDDIGNPTNNPVGNLYSLEADQIEAYLSGQNVEPLHATPISLVERGIRDQVYQFDGFEAIACEGDRLWLSMETIDDQGRYVSYVVGATAQLGEPPYEILVDTEPLFNVVSQSGLKNIGDEALLYHKEGLISLHEVNSKLHVAASKVTRFDLQSGRQAQFDFPPLAYRLTDVSAVDEYGLFWAMNYQWQGGVFLQDDKDKLFAHIPRGRSHREELNVERLVEFKLLDDRIELTDADPIQLQLTQENGRNWEGIVRFKDKGFLLITDEFPETRFGFVPYPR